MESEVSLGWRMRARPELGCWEIVNEDDEQVAVLPAFDSMENARKRAELFQKSPQLVDVLCDLLAVVSKELPEHMQYLLKSMRELVSTIRR